MNMLKLKMINVTLSIKQKSLNGGKQLKMTRLDTISMAHHGTVFLILSLKLSQGSLFESSRNVEIREGSSVAFKLTKPTLQLT